MATGSADRLAQVVHDVLVLAVYAVCVTVVLCVLFDRSHPCRPKEASADTTPAAGERRTESER